MKDIPSTVHVYQGSKALKLVATPFQEVLRSNTAQDILYRILLMLVVRIIGSAYFYRFIFKKQKNLGYYDLAISYFNDVPHDYFNQGTNQYVLNHTEAGVKLAWIHTDPIQAGFDKNSCRNIYKDFDALVCVSHACADKFKEFLPEYAHKIKTAYNLFPIEEILGKAKRVWEDRGDESLLTFITVTRVENGSKNLKRIREVCQKLKQEGISNYKWIIVGDGPDLQENRREIKEAELSDRVIYIGSRKNPYPYILSSDLFILTSNYEGFPMAIQEALILGVPVLTTPYAAVNEQVNHGVNGLITEMSVESIFRHLKNILEQPAILKELKANIRYSPVDNQKATEQLSDLITQAYRFGRG